MDLLDGIQHVVAEVNVSQQRHFAACGLEGQRVKEKFSGKAVLDGLKAALICLLARLLEGEYFAQAPQMIRLALGLDLLEMITGASRGLSPNHEIIVVVAINAVDIPAFKYLQRRISCRLMLHVEAQHRFPADHFSRLYVMYRCHGIECHQSYFAA